MKVEFIDKMGTDLSIVNAARVSMDKSHTVFDEDADNRLLRYMAKSGHWSPFGHVMLSVRITASIAVARQLAKHQVGLCWNEISRRYVSSDPTYHIPESWRSKVESVKQGSGGDLPDHVQEVAHNVFIDAVQHCDQAYAALLEAGVAPEQARLVLPLATETTWIWTGSLAAFHRVCDLRLDDHAQQETRAVAQEIAAICKEHFSNAGAAVVDAKNG